jgi:hypothetical protein
MSIVKKKYWLTFLSFFIVLNTLFLWFHSRRYFYEENQFIYWKDDEHWNIKGISLAADVMCQTIKELKCIDN